MRHAIKPGNSEHAGAVSSCLAQSVLDIAAALGSICRRRKHAAPRRAKKARTEVARCDDQPVVMLFGAQQPEDDRLLQLTLKVFT